MLHLVVLFSQDILAFHCWLLISYVYHAFMLNDKTPWLTFKNNTASTADVMQ